MFREQQACSARERLELGVGHGSGPQLQVCHQHLPPLGPQLQDKA